jgi:apolipoprotein D and lipocalin family protein
VLYVDEGYTLAVVGAPKGTTGWILARGPEISDAQRAKAEMVLTRNGYDVSRLRDVAHGG